MLRLCLSTDRKANSAMLLHELCEKKKPGQILLVPEQFSHTAERKLCEFGGATINRYAEVLSFSRLASRVFTAVGGSAETQTDASGKLLMMSLAVENVRSRLKLYGTSAEKPAFLLKLIDTLEELRSYCVTPQMLRQASTDLSGVLALKMEEFALLMESYDSVCANLGQNPESRLTRLLHALDGSDFAQDKCFYIDAFLDFNGVEREILATLLNGGADITVALCCDDLHSSALQFSAARATAKELWQIASKQGIETRISVLEEKADRPLSALKTRLFGGETAAQTEQTDQIIFIESGDETEECSIAAGQILKLIESGVRYRDITVACADYETYRFELETVFRRAEIPAYYAGDTDILRQNVIHMLLSAMEAATGGMDTQSVLYYLKSGFLRIARDRCDRLENYVLLWGIRGSQWEREWVKSPFGLSEGSEEKSQALLSALNEDRVAFVMPLIRLREGLHSAKNTAQMVLALNRFLDEIELNEQLHSMTQQLQQHGQLQRAQEYAQVYAIICAVLEQMYGVLGSSVHTPEAFCDLFRTALSQCSVGTIPATLDSVSVGSLLSQRCSDSKYLFLIGANEGAFPSAQTNATLLSEKERTSLLHYGIGLNPSVTGGLERELAAMVGVLDVPTQRLYFGGVNGRESYYLLRAKKLFPNTAKCTDDRDLIVRSRRDYLNDLLSHPEQIDGARSLREKAQKLVAAKDHTMGRLTETTVKALYGKTLRLSSSKIDTLASCRLSHFFKYGLKAQERKPAQVDAAVFGTFVHDVLENTSRQVMQEGGFDAVPLERVLQIADERMEIYAREMLADLWGSERAEYLFRRSFSEVRGVVTQLWREMSVSQFRPQWFEMKFGKGQLMPSVKIVGEKMTAELEGVVDRADVWRSGDTVYVRVVDYKTGKTTFEPEKILHGIGMQMLLYLFALRRSGAHLLDRPLTCAGVMYFPASVKKVVLEERFDAKAEEKRREAERRSGMLLDNAAVLQAMEPGEAPIFLPKKDSLATSEQFDLLEDYVLRMVAALADELASGEIKPNPFYISDKYNACAKCSYAEVCGAEIDKRWISPIKEMNEFWQAVEEVCTDG